LPLTTVNVDGNDARYTLEISSMIPMAQAACNNKKNSSPTNWTWASGRN
jgi:hypothetical protein